MLRRVLAALWAVAFATAFLLVPAAKADTLPGSFYWKLPMRLDQSARPECVVYAGELLAEWLYPGAHFDIAGTWAALVARGEAGSFGSSPDAFLSYFQTVGLRPVGQTAAVIFREWRQPDTSATGFHYVRLWWHRPALAPAFGGVRRHIHSFTSVDIHDPVALERALLHGPLMVSLEMDRNWQTTRLDGAFKAPDGLPLGPHELLIYGYQHRGTDLYWDVANSWGEMWGYKGLGYMPDSDRSTWTDAWSVTR